MWLAAILLVFSVPQSGNATRAESNSAVAVSNASEESSFSDALPSAPEPKIKADDAGLDADAAVAAALTTGSVTPGVAPAIEPGYTPAKAIAGAPLAIAPVKPFIGRPYETAKQRKLWYALSFTGSGAAAFDAWSTRRAISQGYGVEGNPLLRPFSHSNALYAATQVSPLVMDYLGKRLMVSRHRILRKMWWLPQAAGSTISLTAAVHNVGLVP
jgi:hypothetical protein